ncbi:MAG TPA: 16S rRNA (cytidine(1402)-2'-O)-methyltransferase [Xanthobacteraceae bacterium]|nr:16S rRNA (cytidine(1402)-2'-O)-methyltransferase [Xanthobacteraceae bacterium]
MVDKNGRSQGTRDLRTPGYMLAGRALAAPKLPAGLYLVATPIGNLADITLRAIETLAAADVIACEDTRVTRRLLDRYAITTPLTPYHDHNAAAARPKLLARLAAGEAVALVSDAGTPLVSDPGYKLAREAGARGHAVVAVPGASAVLTALAVSGAPTDRFLFEGFLPPRSAARRTRIAELARIPATLVLFESGPRIEATLADLAGILGVRDAAICRELTKLHEEIRRGDLVTLAAEAAEREKRGEFVLVIGPPRADEHPVTDLDDLLLRALERGSVKDAVAQVADATGRPKREIYQRALALTQGRDDAAAG